MNALDPIPLEQAERLEGDQSWLAPVPIVLALPAVTPFDRDMLPSVIADYVLDVADRQQAPPDFVAVAALCGLAALLGNKVRIRPKQQDDWTVTPNLWGAIIGRPSAMKSPAMASALRPVYDLERAMREAWEGGIKTKAVDDALAALTQKDNKKQAEKAMRSGDRDRARSLLENLSGEEREDSPCPRLIVNDATVEKLGELLNENPTGLLLNRDELAGFLARMESEEYQSDRAFYLEAFNGDGKFTYDRIGRGTVHIENCTLSLIGGVQPTRIAPLVRAALSGINNDGLIQRLQLAVWPDDLGSWEWIDRAPDLKAKLAYEQAFKDMHELALDGAALMRFTPEAQAIYRDWVTETQLEARSGHLSSILESHLLKMPKTVASLALIFELLDGSRVAVGEQAAERALRWARYLRSHAKRLYAAGEVMAENGAKLILERRDQLPEQFTTRDIQRKDWAGLTDRNAIEASVEVLVSTHHCREQPAAPGPQGGRPSLTFRWNPCLSSAAKDHVGRRNGTDRTDETSEQGVLSVLSVPPEGPRENFRDENVADTTALTRVAPTEPAPLPAVAAAPSAQSAKFVPSVQNGADKTDKTGGRRISFDVPAEYVQRLAELQRACPEGVPPDRWHLCLEDSAKFFARWGRQAQKLGWSSQDLFGLHGEAPMARYDEMGLLWTLKGRTVIDLGGKAAKLSGGLTFRRRG
jgi:hypothetical protein